MSREGGDCYAAALACVLDYGGELVHAEVWHESSGWHGHAWVEVGGAVLEVANGRRLLLSRAWYYDAGKVRDVRWYSQAEAATRALEHQHCGPW